MGEIKRVKLLDLGDAIARIKLERKMVPGRKWVTRVSLLLMCPSSVIKDECLYLGPVDIEITDREHIIALRDGINEVLFDLQEIDTTEATTSVLSQE
ncbi:MAG: hypothetical protein AB1847_22460 [bacterium]